MIDPTEDAKRLREEAGAYIQQLRMDRGLTQRELADIVGLDYYTRVAAVETGMISLSSDQLKLWARALKVPRRKFARTMLRFYNPHTAKELFGDHEKS